MNCRDVRLLLTRYVDGEADKYEHMLIAQHLAECAACAAQASQLRLTRQRVQREIKRWAASAMPPTRARERLLARLAAEKDTVAPTMQPDHLIDSPVSRKMALLRRMALAGLVLLVIAACIALLLRNAL